MGYFVMISEQGPAWNPARSMREQAQWTEHAAFINGLAASGCIILGGPLGNRPPHRALLVVNSPSEADLRARFAEDPWVAHGTLRVVSVEPWEVLVSDDRLDPALAQIIQQGPVKPGEGRLGRRDEPSR